MKLLMKQKTTRTKLVEQEFILLSCIFPIIILLLRSGMHFFTSSIIVTRLTMQLCLGLHNINNRQKRKEGTLVILKLLFPSYYIQLFFLFYSMYIQLFSEILIQNDNKIIITLLNAHKKKTNSTRNGRIRRYCGTILSVIFIRILNFVPIS